MEQLLHERPSPLSTFFSVQRLPAQRCIFIMITITTLLTEPMRRIVHRSNYTTNAISSANSIPMSREKEQNEITEERGKHSPLLPDSLPIIPFLLPSFLPLLQPDLGNPRAITVERALVRRADDAGGEDGCFLREKKVSMTFLV